MNLLDWLALALVALAALAGTQKGLVGGALSAVGIGVGAVAGARLAPQLLSQAESPYTPLVALLGAAVGAVVLETLGALAGHAVRRSLRSTPLRALDATGGLVLGAVAGLALVWVLGAVVLHLPGQRELAREAQRSLVLRRLNEVAPPARVMKAIQRVDPFPEIVGPRPPTAPPDRALLRDPSVAAAARSTVRVTGTACGLAVSGSGWVAARDLVVTAAHVVAGQRDTTVAPANRLSQPLPATAVVFDTRNDLAVLRVRDLGGDPLVLGDADRGEPVAVLGYPHGGPLRAAAGRIGRTVTVLTQDAYGRAPVRREVTTVSGDIRRGHSGGPAVNRGGEVEATVFAARLAGDGGFAVPPGVVRRHLRGPLARVSTGACTG